MSFQPNFQTTLIGSFPHKETTDICRKIVEAVDIPIWPQLPRRDYREGIYVQYAAALPGVILNDVDKKITLDTRGDLTPELEIFYAHYLANDFDHFALPPEFAAGFHTILPYLVSSPGKWVKGQVVGPLTFGLSVVDQDRRAVYYHDLLRDVIIKNMAMNARWQIHQLKSVRSEVIIFVDEPYLGSYGTAYVSIDRRQASTALDEIFAAIHAEGAMAGVHCCANTDWAILLRSKVDILNIDAYGYLPSLALYPDDLRRFLNRGGLIAWGIVPNDEKINTETPRTLAKRLQAGFTMICEKAAPHQVTITPQELAFRSLITPTCGLGSTTPEIVDKVLQVLSFTKQILIDEYVC